MKNAASFFAPGRLNIIGEHTDYADGYVMPAPLELGIRFDDVVSSDSWNIHSEATGEQFSGDPERNWTGSPALHGFVHALVKVARGHDLEVSPLNGVLRSDLPTGNGLSSSTALTSVLLLGMAHWAEWPIGRRELAFIAREVEQQMGIQCGIMDQFCMWLGYPGKAMVLDCESLESRPVAIFLEGHRWLLILSGVRHDLLGSPYNVRRQQLFRGIRYLNELGCPPEALKGNDATTGKAISAFLEGVTEKRVRYLWQENMRVLDMEEALREGDAARVARLLNEGQKGLSDDYEVSCQEIDHLVRIFQDKIPTAGIRMVGGGFGGALIALVPDQVPDDRIRDVLADYEAAFPVKASMLPVTLGDTVRKL